MRALELRSDLFAPDRGMPDALLNRTARDQRLHGHQDILRHSERSPNTGPDSVFTAVTPVLHTK